MPTLQEIDAAIENRRMLDAIDAEIALRNQAPTAEQVQARIDTPQQEPLSFLEQVKGGAEGVASLVTGAVAEPVAGIFGLAAAANPFAKPGAGGAVVDRVREFLTFKPESREGQAALENLGGDLQFLVEPLQNLKKNLGDEAFANISDPEVAALVGTITSTLPEAALELLGAGTGKRAVTQATRNLPTETPSVAGVVSDADLDNIATTLKKGNEAEVSNLIKADPEFFRAADELGISTEPLASFASKNPQFVAVESGLASVPSSALDVQTKNFISDVSKQADNLIEQFGGTLDKGQLNIDFKRTALETVENLAKQADDVYGTIAEVLPKTDRFEAPNTVSFLTEKAKELGGVKQLPSKLKTIFSQLSSKTTTKKGTTDPITGKQTTRQTGKLNPTLGKIDQIRREVGQAINKKSGPFKDVEQGLNKALYARLTRDQDAIAQAAGFGDITEAAKGLIIQRKGLEDNLAVLLGKDLNQALSVNVAGAVKGLAKNDIGRFKKVIDAIPKAQRGEVVLSAMNDVFRGTGVGQQSLSPTQFVKWFQNIERSPAVKAELFKALPKGSPQAIQNLFKVSSGISRALGDRVTTGRLNAMFNEETGFLRRMIGKSIPTAVAVATGSPVASVAANATMDFLRQSTTGAQKTSELLASPQFQAIIRRSVKEGVIDGSVASAGLQKAEAALRRTKRFKEWKKTLSSAQRKSLESSALMSYLFINEPEE